ncbi:MAG: helix-turn-helix domain-containing protein [Deltaproteobacteria bacterium]|nr:helix-turn-helix domain-containing protein [Deltaproteobacteria bacterium]
MSVPTIAPYFPFRRIKIVDQIVLEDACEAQIRIQPDKRFQPICHCCGHRASGVHSWTERRVRDLNLAATPVWIKCPYRKVFCAHCHRVSVEDLELFHPYLRVTTRLARYVYQLCQLMTVTDVARHLALDWKTVKTIDKQYLEQDYGQPRARLGGRRDLAGPTLLRAIMSAGACCLSESTARQKLAPVRGWVGQRKGARKAAKET